jgi:hypothetical protein
MAMNVFLGLRNEPVYLNARADASHAFPPAEIPELIVLRTHLHLVTSSVQLCPPRTTPRPLLSLHRFQDLNHASSPNGGKNGRSVPKSILEAPSCRLPPPTTVLSYSTPTPCGIATRPPNCFADESELGCPVRDGIEPQSVEVLACVVRRPSYEDLVIGEGWASLAGSRERPLA